MIPRDQSVALALASGAIAMMALVLLRYRTVLLGFSFFAFFNIASASLSAFLNASIFGLSRTWVTPGHETVFIVTSMGLITFAAGVWIAWRPLKGRRGAAIWQTPRPQSAGAGPEAAEPAWPPWLNPRFATLCLALGVATYLLTPIAFRIPTVQVVWSTLYSLLPLGVLVALLSSQIRRNYAPLLLGLAALIPMALLTAVTTGHIGVGGTFLVQLLLVACFAFGVRAPMLPVFAAGTLLLTSLIVGWMSSRDIIRSGELAGYDEIDRVTTFLQRFEYTNPLDLTPTDVQHVVRLRVDMSDILAAQVYYQPEVEPYAYGGTVLNNLAAALVPRFIWPEKPRFSGGDEFVSRYTGIDFGDNVSVGLPYQFELYANGGAPLVVGGLFIIGWLTATLERRLVHGAHSLPTFLVLSYLTAALAAGGQTIITVILSMLAGTIGFFVLGHMLAPLNRAFPFWLSADESRASPTPVSGEPAAPVGGASV